MENFLTSFGFRTPFLFMGGNFYLSSLNRASDYFEIHEGMRLGLVPAGSIADVLRFQKIRNSADEYDFKKAFIEARCNTGYVNEDKKADLSRAKLVQFIVEKLMPHMSGQKEVITDIGENDEVHYEIVEEVKGEKKPVNPDDLARNIDKLKADMKNEQEVHAEAFAKGDDAAYIRSITGNSDFLVLGGMIYSLQKTDTGHVINFKLGEQNERRTLVPLESLKSIGEKYSAFLDWKAKLEAVDEFTEYIAQKEKVRIEAFGNLEEILKLKEFNNGEIGFLNEGNRLYVYHIIKPFGMLDPRPDKQEICYEFPKLRVGLSISYYCGELTLNEPVLFEPVWHPFVSHKDTPFQHICGGHVPSHNGHSDVEWVAVALDDAKNVIMHGLTPQSIVGHGGNRDKGGQYFGTPLDEKLAPRIIKISQALEKNLILTNKWNWDKR